MIASVSGIQGTCFNAAWQDTYTRMWYIYGGELDGAGTNQFFSVSLGRSSTSSLIVETNVPPLPSAIATKTTQKLSSVGAIPTRFSTMFPLLPYYVNAATNQTSLVIMGVFSQNNTYQIWNASSQTWYFFEAEPEFSQVQNAAPVAIPTNGRRRATSYSVIVVDGLTPSLWQLSTVTRTAFVVPVLSNQSQILVSFPNNAPIISVIPKGRTQFFSPLRKVKINNIIIDGTGTPEPVAEATFGFSDISEVMSNGSVVTSVGLTQGLLNLGISKTTSTGVQTYAFISTDKSVRFPPFFSRFYPCSYFASCCRSCCSLFC